MLWFVAPAAFAYPTLTDLSGPTQVDLTDGSAVVVVQGAKGVDLTEMQVVVSKGVSISLDDLAVQLDAQGIDLWGADFAVSTSETAVRDAASGLPTGKRMHKPYTITCAGASVYVSL